jgi:hypothetical protein
MGANIANEDMFIGKVSYPFARMNPLNFNLASLENIESRAIRLERLPEVVLYYCRMLVLKD